MSLLFLSADKTLVNQEIGSFRCDEDVGFSFCAIPIGLMQQANVWCSRGGFKKVQLVQNAEARLVTGAREFDHITPVLREFHWLPVKQGIIFKIGVIMFKCFNGGAPDYLGS